MKRILYISHFLNVAGTESFMMNSYRRLDRKRYAIDFLIFDSAETVYTREVTANGDRLYRLPARREGLLKYLHALRAFFAQHATEYQVVHWCTGNLSTIAPLVMAQRYGIRTRIIHAHSTNCAGRHNRLLHGLNRHLLAGLCTDRLACSQAAADFFYGKGKATIIRNGIETSRYAYNPAIRAEMRRSMGIADGEKVMGHVGRCDRNKNHRKLLDVFATAVKMSVADRLLMIGQGDTETEIQAQIESLGIAERVLWIRQTNEVNRYMQAMDVFVMPSLFEGLPFVLVEAQAAGLPCVLSDTIQSDSRINSNMMFLPLSETDTAWAVAIQRLTAEERTDRLMTVKNAGYDIQTTIQQLEKIYDKP